MGIFEEILTIFNFIGDKINKSCRNCAIKSTLNEYQELDEIQKLRSLKKTKCNLCKRSKIGKHYGYKFDFWEAI